ncbi:MAG: hypothetical protein J0H74_19730 [Chitinophagaceae bacterium]|nr:hypothetical protein [Chitinophagaceae bacterium]
MKNSITLCILVFFICSCRKDSQEKHAGPDPVKVDLTSKVSCSVSGYVSDENGDPIIFAQVFSGDKQTVTDKYGFFSIENVSLPATAGLIKVVSNRYFIGYRTFSPQKGKGSFVHIGMIPKKEAGVVDAATGGEATTLEGGKVVLPANAVVVAAGGAPYAGKVHIYVRWIDPAGGSGLQLGVPGDGRGADNSGFLKTLKSYGIMAVELAGDGGQLLQIAPGKTATINIPIPSSLSSAAPATIPLWAFNDSLGLWRQEGVATKNGNVFTGASPHFSFWNGAEGADLVNFKARIVDAAAHPLANVPVSITPVGIPLNTGYGRFGFSDADGNVIGAIPANSSLVLQVMTPCTTPAYAQSFSSTFTDIDLGQITGNMGQNIVTITGTVTNCDHQPVSNGYVQTYDHGFYHRIPIVNGSFSLSGITCTNLAVNVVAVDNTTHQQGEPKTVMLTAGNNDLGALTACGSSTMGSLSYTIDNVTTNITEPADTIGGYFLVPIPDAPASKWTQIITLSGNVDHNPQLTFQFDGESAAGEGHHVTEVFSPKFPGGRGYWPVPITVNITEYGEIGGFISGSFSNQLIDFANNGIHTFSCTFRIRRYN